MSDLPDKAVVIGAGGGIGQAVAAALTESGRYIVHLVSRNPLEMADPVRCWTSDYSDDSIAEIATLISEEPGALRRLIICNGVLHGNDFRPERALKQLTGDSLRHVLAVNTVVPALWLGAFGNAIQSAGKTAGELKVAVFSARVGSIKDNTLGGWYSYRASKAALNMVLRTAAIEIARLNKSAKILAFHPGTTDTAMSRPFQKGVPADKLFTPAFVAERLLSILDDIPVDGELSYLDWAGEPIDW